MEGKNCGYLDCGNPALSISKNSQEIPLCLNHMNEHKQSCFPSNGSSVEVISDNFILDPQKTILKSSYMFSVEIAKSNIPDELLDSMNGLSIAFVNSVLSIGNGQSEKVQNLCLDYSIALKEIIYNIEIDFLILTNEVNELYCSFHSEKQSIISEMLSEFLNSQEKLYNMPKTATKNLISELNLDTIKQNFIYEFFMKDSIVYEELYHLFCKNFSEFLAGKTVNFHKFSGFKTELNAQKENLIIKYRKQLLGVTIERWLKSEYQLSSVIASNLLLDPELSFKIATLFLCKSVVTLNSVTKLSISDYLIILLIENHSYIILYSEKTSVILCIFHSCDYICAEGSDRELILLFDRFKNCFELFNLTENDLVKQSNVDLKLLINERVFDLILLQGSRPKIVFCSNLYAISQVYYNGLRTFINLSSNQLKTKMNLFYYRQKELIILKSDTGLIAFTEFLEKLGEFHIELQDVTYVESNQRVVKVLGVHKNCLKQVSLNINLNYPETLSTKILPILGSIRLLTRKSYERKVFCSTMSHFDIYFSKTFQLVEHSKSQ